MFGESSTHEVVNLSKTRVKGMIARGEIEMGDIVSVTLKDGTVSRDGGAFMGFGEDGLRIVYREGNAYAPYDSIKDVSQSVAE